MDNRTGFRPADPVRLQRNVRGHAVYADMARRALGVELHGPLAELRAPLFHFVIGALVAGIAVLGRPQQVGVALGIAIDALLAVLASLALLVFDRLFCPPEARPGPAGGALPTAALLAEAVVLAGTQQKALWVPAAVVAALVIAGAPHLSAMALAGREAGLLRVARDAAGVAAMWPVLIAGTSSVFGPLRGAILAAGAFLTVVDALHTERAALGRTLLAAASVAAAVGGALVPADHSGQAVAAATLLVLWYGLRGWAVTAVGRWSWSALLEYGVFVGIAAALLAGALRR